MPSMPAAPSTVVGGDHDWPFHEVVWLPAAGAARQKEAEAQETEMVPGPIADPAGDCGVPHDEPLKA